MNRELAYWDDIDITTSDTDDNDDSDEADESSQGTSQKNNENKSTQDSQKISDEILIGLNRLRDNEMFFDITIITGQKKIRAHKIVLCAASPYFNAMFTGSFIENNHDEVTLQDVDEEMIELLINYIYSGQLPFNSDNVDRVLLTAQFLQIDSAVNICFKHIKNKMSIKNCLNLISFAGKHSLKTLCDALIEFIIQNFDKLINNDNFNKIEYLEYKRLISDKRILLYPPDVILSLIFGWINFEYENRVTYLNELLRNVNTRHITKEILDSPRILNNIKKSDFMKWFNKRPLLDTTDLTNWDIAVFKYTGSFVAELYKLHSQATAQIKPLPCDYFDGSYVSYGGAIYHTGGCVSKKPVTNETHCWSIYKNTWKQFINLNIGRAYHRNCMVDTSLYSIGGTNGGYSAFTTCEYIDFGSAKSFNFKDLNKPRERMGLTVHNNVIYAIGGKNRGRCKYRCAERYDPRVGEWEMLNSVPYESGISSSVTIGDEIYCTTSSKTLERYDIKGDCWTKIITQFNSYPLELFTINNELYGVFRNDICLYEHLLGKWKPPSARFGHVDDNLTAIPVLIAP